jgi:hypothetical protein
VNKGGAPGKNNPWFCPCRESPGLFVISKLGLAEKISQ